MSDGDWRFYEKLIVSKLEEFSLLFRHNADTLRRIELDLANRASNDALKRVELEIVQMKTRASMLGFVAGAVPLIATTLYQILVK